MLRWASKLVIVDGHGGNRASVEQAVSRLRYEGREVAWWHCGVVDGDAHAGRTETSLMSFLRPESVHVERACAGRTEPLRELIAELTRSGMIGVSSNGVLGDPTGSSAEEGEVALATMAEQLAAAIATWLVEGGSLGNVSRAARS